MQTTHLQGDFRRQDLLEILDEKSLMTSEFSGYNLSSKTLMKLYLFIVDWKRDNPLKKKPEHKPNTIKILFLGFKSF